MVDLRRLPYGSQSNEMKTRKTDNTTNLGNPPDFPKTIAFHHVLLSVVRGWLERHAMNTR